MDHTTRTIIFGVVAVVAVSMGFATKLWTQPKDPDQFTDEGTPFYAEFSDPFEARSIEVAVYNDETDTPEEFSVEFQDGVWRIPTHYNYPADGQDQLSKTATSVIGITRDSLQSESKDDHQGLGVVDPLDENITSGKGCGTHVKLIGENDKVLVDYIIGKRPDENDNRYYIRRADEDRTYLARLDIQVSTKFTDWIEPDLLQVERNSIVELFVNDYSVVETPLPDGGLEIGFEPQENVELTRESGGFQWSLEGLDATTESIKTGVVNAMLTALDDLKIVGVRPKPEILQAILRGEQAEGASLARRQMESDMASKGYYLLETSPGLLSNEGALIVGTDEGVSYQLLVGNVFVGTQNEIEIGGESETAETSEPVEEAEAPVEEGDAEADAAAEGTDATEAAEEELAPGEQRSRYLFILTSFDEKLLGPKPEPPVMPTPPGEAVEGATEPAEEATETSEDTTEADAPAESTDEEATEATDPATDAEAVEDEASDESAEATEEATEPDTEAEAPQCDDPTATDEPAGDEPATETDAAAEETPATETEATDDAATETAVDDPAVTDDATQAEPTDDAADATDTEPAADDAADATEGTEETEAPAAPTAEELQAAYETAMLEYDAAVRKYETDLEDYNTRLEAGQKKAEELRVRFAEWYYVIPADVFDDLDVSRADLVGPKTDPAAGGAGGAPDFNLPGLPGLPEGHPEIPELPLPEGTEEEATEVDADPMTETPEADAGTEESTEAEAATTDEEATETETPESTPESPEAEGSQSGESGESPAAEPDSEADTSTIEGEAATPE